GPIMIGPSSSHTAGAVRVGLVANQLVGDISRVSSVDCYFHGSFATTYKGHRTDIAIIAGILGFMADDTRIPDALDIAKRQGICTNFIPCDLGNYHENTAKVVVTLKDKSTVTVVGSSIGGGNIKIVEIDGFSCNFAANTNSLIIRHNDERGVIAHVSTVLAQSDVNIATMTVLRTKKGDDASMVIECDSPITDDIIEQIKRIKSITNALYIAPAIY
ncbi:MAG: L-serine ammonia-lyase, iron-sulfur-dependent subunit beta, partial [Niameybacter sp.]